MSDHTATAGAALAELIDAHVDRSVLNDDDRAMLREFFEADFDDLDCTGWVRADSTDSTADLTLGAAQELQRALVAGESLSARQLHHAEVLLKYAPLQFGYWGPFKAVVKAMPLEHLAEAYGDAVARLSSAHPEQSEPDSVRIENVDFLKDWFDVPLPKTRRYLARRVRRNLASLAKQSPDMYARVAARMLISWDQPLSDVAYAPAYVMLGARGTLDERGKHVRWPADMDARRDAHPEIWNERPELVREVSRAVRLSIEVLTWSFQVLQTFGAEPDIAADATGLALDADYPDLRRFGCVMLPQHPEIFGTLTTQQWTAFFQNATDDEVGQAADALTAQDPHEPVAQALVAVLERPDVVSDRRARMSLLYLAARKVSHAVADIAALVAVVERFHLDHQSLWNPVLDGMSPHDRVEVYRTLADDGANDESLEVVANAIVVGKSWVAPDLILECVGSDNPKVAELGWRLVEARGGNHYFFSRLLPSAGGGHRVDRETALRIVSASFPRASTTEEVVGLIRWALSAETYRPTFAAMLAETPLGCSALWEGMATRHGAETWTLAGSTPDVVRRVGEAVLPQQLSTAGPDQLAMVLRYVETNPARIARDVAFGVAAFETADPSLQAEALRQLEATGHVSQTWLVLGESTVPGAFEVAREHVESLQDVGQVRDAILLCLDSGVPAVRDMGIHLVRARDELSQDQAVWTALAESSDRRAQEIVAEMTLVSSRVDEQVLAQFDQRILSERPPNRRAKEFVKRRIETADIATTSVPSERIAALLDLARGEVEQDREWALMRLAALAIRGVPVDGLEVSLTTTGTTVLEDVEP